MEWLAIASIVMSIIGIAIEGYQSDEEFDRQQQLMRQNQSYQSERENLAWQRQRPQQEYSDFLETGFNPNLAAQAVLGGASQTASTSGAPSSPPVNSALGALGSMFNTSQSNFLDSFMKEAQIENLNANTEQTKVQTGLAPLQFQLKKEETDAIIKKYEAETNLSSEQANVVRQSFELHQQIDPITVQQFSETLEKTIEEKKLLIEQQQTQQKERDVMDADIMLKNAETGKAKAEENLAWANSSVVQQEYSHIETFGSRLGSDFVDSIVGLLEKGTEESFRQAQDMASLYYQLTYKRKTAEQVAESRHGKSLSPFQFLDKGFGLGRYMNTPWFDPYPGIVPNSFNAPVWNPTYHR